MEEDQVLEALNQYAQLWEQRILELSPGHSIPVTPDMLGQSSTPVRLTENLTFPQPSTNLTHQQLFDLYGALFYKLQEMDSQREQLEASLKSEIMLNEEQRIQLDLLSQAVDTRMDELGIVNGTVEDFSSVIKAQRDAQEAQENAVMLENLVQDKETKLTALVEKYKKTTLEKENLTSTSSNLQQSVQNKKVKYNTAKQEIATLSTDVTMLQADLQRSIVNVKKQNEEIKMLRTKGENYRKQLNDSTSALAKLRGEMSAKENEVSELRLEIEEKDITIEAERSAIEDLANENTQQSTNLINLEQQMNEEVKNLTDENTKLKVEVDTLHRATETLQIDLNAERDQHQIARQDITHNKNEILNHKQTNEQLRVDFESTSNQLMQTEETVTRKNHEIDRLSNTIAHQNKDLESMQSLQDTLAQQLSTSENERKLLVSSLELSEAKLAEIQSRYDALIRESEDQIVDQMELTRNVHSQLDREIENRRSKEHWLSQTNHTIYQLTEKVAALSKDIETVQATNDDLTGQLEAATVYANDLLRQMELHNSREEEFLGEVARLAPGCDFGQRQDPLQTVIGIIHACAEEISQIQSSKEKMEACLDDRMKTQDYLEIESERLRQDLKGALEEISQIQSSKEKMEACLDDRMKTQDYLEIESERLREDLKGALEEIVHLRERLNTPRNPPKQAKRTPRNLPKQAENMPRSLPQQSENTPRNLPKQTETQKQASPVTFRRKGSPEGKRCFRSPDLAKLMRDQLEVRPLSRSIAENLTHQTYARTGFKNSGGVSLMSHETNPIQTPITPFSRNPNSPLTPRRNPGSPLTHRIDKNSIDIHQSVELRSYGSRYDLKLPS